MSFQTTQYLLPSGRAENTASRRPPRYSSLEDPLSPDFDDIPFEFSDSITFTHSDENATEAESTTTGPPRYSSAFHHAQSSWNLGQQPSAINELAAGFGDLSVASRAQVFDYHIKSGNNSKSHPWATLTVFSPYSAGFSNLGPNTSSGPMKVPKFTSKDLVEGCLELSLSSPLNINSISLSLRGTIITGCLEDGCYTFLDHNIFSWTRANGDPWLVGISKFNSNRSAKKFGGKFSGSYFWPFSFQFPSEVVLQNGRNREQKIYPAPQTFLERGVNANVQYEIVLRMSHGLLKADSKLKAGIVYFPETIPPAFSLLRNLAYNQGKSIPGPEADPRGWHNSPPAVIFGKLPNGQAVKLQCMLSLAKPLIYTRGTFIPLHLTVLSSNKNALDLLSDPKEINARLVRCLRYYQDATHSLSLSRGDKAKLDDAIEETTVMENALWSMHRRETENKYVRHFEGEIHLKKDMQPSCEFYLFRISYDIEFLAFNNFMFKSSTSAVVLLSHPVAIATQNREGQVPVPITTPDLHDFHPNLQRTMSLSRSTGAPYLINLTELSVSE